MSWSHSIAGSLNQSIHVGHALLGGKVIHLIVHEKTETLHRDE